MTYDFDTVIDRRNTNCLKYDFTRERGMPDDVLPLWVADMDFQAPPAVLERLEQLVRHGIFGYSESKEEYFAALAGWYERHFSWQIKRSWLVKTPGVVFAIATAIRAFTQEGDSVMIQQPVYYPFSETIRENNRKLVSNSLQLRDGHYEIDFDDFENKIIDNKVKLFLLCSPHNPVGRVWKEWELRRIGEICLRHHVLVVSDEIHADFTWQENRHLVFAGLDPAFAKITVTCTAPSKTFNLAGLQVSNIFIPDPELRRRFRGVISASGYSQLNVMGLAACQAAYEGGEEWLREVKEYIWDNYLYLKNYLADNIPQLHAIEPEGTYLIWIDLRELGLSADEQRELVVKKAHLWLDSGAIFGADSAGFERINIACPRKTLDRALGQLAAAVSETVQ